MFMDLSIRERLLLLGLDTLPQVGNILTLKIKKDIIGQLGFTEQEVKDYGIVLDGDKASWDFTRMDTKDIEIGEQGLSLIIEAMEKSTTLNDDYVPLYDRFTQARKDLTAAKEA